MAPGIALTSPLRYLALVNFRRKFSDKLINSRVSKSVSKVPPSPSPLLLIRKGQQLSPRFAYNRVQFHLLDRVSPSSSVYPNKLDSRVFLSFHSGKIRRYISHRDILEVRLGHLTLITKKAKPISKLIGLVMAMFFSIFFKLRRWNYY